MLRHPTTKLAGTLRQQQQQRIVNAGAAQCTINALRREAARSSLAQSGALVAYSGAKTGRSPTDKRIVAEMPSMKRVWWGPVNTPLPPSSFESALSRARSFLARQPVQYFVDAYAGADARYRLKVRIECSRAYHALFMQNMLITPTAEQLANFGDPDFTIVNAGECSADPSLAGVNGSSTLIAISFERKAAVILGTEYAGEMKKGVFTIMHYLMPLRNVLSLHAAANEGSTEDDVTLFFGLSGTGKTTLSADANRKLIGDDEHCWSKDGIFNIEGGCYAKAIDLSAEKEPEIYNAIRFGAILENVEMDPVTHAVDFSSRAITENTRVCYPLDFIPNSKSPSVAKHPKNIIFLTCDAYGVLPPVSLLSPDQAMYHFLAGYTSKVAGTEQGNLRGAPTATFSPCFGAPFLVHPPALYADLFRQRLEERKTDDGGPGVRCWLVNTGWMGGPAGGERTGKRIPLQYSRSIVDAIHSGELLKSIEQESRVTPFFNLRIPTKAVAGIPGADFFDPANAWKAEGCSEEVYTVALRQLLDRFESVRRDVLSGTVGTVG
ncbi:Protein kinase C-like 1 [Chytriomyces hyalinus]|nr:Protein kinase C-like 1 [Chytriomyces hyalinus]